MKYLTFSVALICAFAAGYFIGSSHISTGVESKMNSPQSANFTQPDDSSDDSQLQGNSSNANHLTPSNSPESVIASNKVGDLRPHSHTQLNDSKNHVQPADYSNEEYSLAQQELDEWVTTYKPRLKQDMIDTLGEDVAQFMFEEITNENAFLNQPVANNHLEDDLSTRHDLEQAIRDFIDLNTIDPETELLNVNCIQGRCEVTLAGKAQNAAIFIFMEISGNAIPALEALKTPTLYVDPEKPEQGYWSYMLFQY